MRLLAHQISGETADMQLLQVDRSDDECPASRLVLISLSLSSLIATRSLPENRSASCWIDHTRS